MKYILARHNKIIRKYAQNGGYCVTDRNNKVVFKCSTQAEAEQYIDNHAEDMSIARKSWQKELWNMLKSGLTVAPMEHGAALGTTNPTSYRMSWKGMCERMKVAGYEVERVGQGKMASYRLVRSSAAN